MITNKNPKDWPAQFSAVNDIGTIFCLLNVLILAQFAEILRRYHRREDLGNPWCQAIGSTFPFLITQSAIIFFGIHWTAAAEMMPTYSIYARVVQRNESFRMS
ncbi:hypothetical protein L596_000373 [Steinernema carpocapsae]|uniref:Uncharacterized protein n=1 Tax=Steinernema carpocapsae TaxID=34508 RepID=A0A4U8UM58_STECR|nr:hypothetical protein L596_000373 [Steinernema carpocapsae]